MSPFAVVAGMKRLLRLAGGTAAVAIAIAACSSGNDSSDSAAPSVASTTSAAAPTTSAPAGGEASSSADDNGPAADSGTIAIQNFAYGTPLTVRPGATIKVTNMDGAAHDVASDDEGKFRTPLLNQGESATFTAPTQPGTYKFSCTVHAQMKGIGTLVVHG